MLQRNTDGMKKTEIEELAKTIANKMKMSYCWEDIYSRIVMGIPLPIELENYGN